MKHDWAKKAISLLLAGLMLLSPASALAETPPPPGNIPIVTDSESSEPGQSADSSEDFLFSDEDTSDTDTPTVSVTTPDSVTEEVELGAAPESYPFPGTVILVDENGRQLPMPRTYPAIVEGPEWDNPGGRSPYFFVTFNGVVAYCVEPFVHHTNGNVSYLQQKNWDGLPPAQRRTVSYLLKFGSPKGNDISYNDWHAATQCLIWEVTSGQRPPDLSGSPGAYYAALVKVFPGMTTKYNQMTQQVKSWDQIPSFASKSLLDAPTYKMEGTGPYSVTLTNTNASCLLSIFKFSFPGISTATSGSKVTFTSATEVTTELTMRGDRSDVTDSSDNFIFWYDPAGKDQTRMQHGPDPVPCYFKLGTENSNPGGGEEPSEPTGDFSLTIRKYESGTNIPLDGAQFHIQYLGTNGDIVVPPPVEPEPDPDLPLGRSAALDTGDESTRVEIPEYETTVTIESSGKITVKVPYRGIYKVTEVVPPENHLLDRNPVQTIVCTDAAPNQTIDFHNDAYTSIRVKKVDKTTGQPLANATIQIEKVDGSVRESRRTGNDGIALFSDLQPGAYRITELQAPEGYELTTEVITRDIQSNRVEEVVLNNQAKAGFRIRKVAAESGHGLQGAVFDLYHKDGAFINSYMSDRNGLITVEKLPEGWYTVIERQPPEGYLLDPDHTSQDVHLTGTSQDVIFRDPKMPSLRIEKIDADTGRKLSGAVFTVRERDGAESFEITTGPDGTIQKDGLKPTWYVITEIKAPNGYVVDSTPIIKQLEAGKTTQVVVRNGQKPTLTIRKVDKISGEGIPGVTLRIAKNGSLEYKDVLTENGGYVILKDMEPGHYSVTEIACPEEYILDSTPHEIEIVVGKNAVLTITNQAKPSLRIEKLDAETRQPLPGAVFNISIKNGKDLGNFTTDQNGQIFLPNCETGLYVIREVSAPNGYLTDTTPVEALVEEGKIKTVTLSNMPEHPLLIKKVDAKTGLPLANATFLVSKVTGEHVGEFVSGRNGFITVTGLVPGFYTIKEIKAPDGYLLNASVQTVELKENEPAIVIFENQPKAGLRLNKVDSKTKEPLAGAKFKLTQKGGNYIGEYTTDAQGQIAVDDLSPGWYTVVETYAPEGYLLDAAPKDIELKWGEVARLELTNTAFSGLQVKKTDAASGEPLESIRFRLTTMNGDFVGDYMTGPGGYFVAQNLTPGWYTCRETATLPGYILDESPKNVQIKADSVSILEFTNVPMNSLQIRKVDAVTKEPLAGIRFRLTTLEGTYVGDYKTNSAGLIAVPNLTPGWYSAFETETVPGYILDTTPQNIKIEANKLAKLEFVNQPESDLLVLKIDSITKKPLAGVKFRLTTMKNELVGDYTTGSGGYFTVNGLTPGWYLISETQTIPGYLLDSTVQRIEIVKGKPATAEFVNQPLNSLQVRKVDSVTGTPIPGVRFRLTRMDGQHVGDYTTDAAGMFAASGLEPGWYTAWELQTIPGYILDTTPQNVQLISGKAATLEFRNVPLSGLQIRKCDSITGAPLGGAEFKVEQPDGRLIGSFVTDNSGIIYIPNLKEGVLIVTETKAPNGYKLDPAPRRIEVRADQLNVLEYRNQPWPILAI